MGGAAFVEGCISDVCQVGPEVALSTGLIAWQTKQALADEISAMTRLVGEGCCKPWRTILNTIRGKTKNECAMECAMDSACGAFATSKPIMATHFVILYSKAFLVSSRGVGCKRFPTPVSGTPDHRQILYIWRKSGMVK